MTMIACSDLALVLLKEHLDRYKVARSEIITGVRLQASSRWFYRAINVSLETNKTSFAVRVTHFSNDATHGNMHKHQKMSTCIADSAAFIEGVTDAGTIGDLPSQRRCCDILTVNGGTAQDTMSLLCKHLDSIGAPNWHTKPASPLHLELFSYTSDRGSDQTALRDIVPHDIREPNTSLLSTDCLDHSSQCIESSALKMLDVKTKAANKPWTYYSSCVKLGHSWRGYHVPMYTHINRDDEDEISKHAKYMCPVCDSGRWGAVHGFEDKVLGLTIPIFHKHYKQVIEDTKQRMDE